MIFHVELVLKDAVGDVLTITMSPSCISTNDHSGISLELAILNDQVQGIEN